MNERKKRGVASFLRGKKVLVMGLGLHGGGVSTVKFLAKQGAQVIITDLRSKKELTSSLDALSEMSGIRYALGKHDEKDLRNVDYIIKNPGVRPRAPYLLSARKAHIPVLSDIGIFFALCPALIIGVTGTRGKSTTAHLIWKFLKIKKERVFLGGNIRKSPLDFLDHLRKNDIVVLELSSFQLYDLCHEDLALGNQRKSPHIAVLTNILRDHLNWHANMQEYKDAKAAIFQFQKKGEYLFANPDDPIARGLAKKAPGRVIFPHCAKKLSVLVQKNLGAHYESSAALAVAVARHFKIPDKAIQNVLKEFTGLPGRQEYIGIVHGVHVVNDTTATMPDATIAALRRFRPRAKGKLILIAGGQDKNLNFQKMAREAKKSADTLILLPGTGTEKMIREVRGWRVEGGGKKIYQVKSMREAVEKAFLHAKKGDYILFSPGAASFGLFLNEFDRGEQFVNSIRELSQTT